MNRRGDREMVLCFFQEARRAAAEDSRIDAPYSEILLVAEDIALRALFRAEFGRLNDPALQALIKDFLADLIVNLDGDAERYEIYVDLVDRAGMTPSAALTVAGIVTIATGGFAWPLLLFGGLVGTGASAVGRIRLRNRMQQIRMSARKVRQLRDLL